MKIKKTLIIDMIKILGPILIDILIITITKGKGKK